MKFVETIKDSGDRQIEFSGPFCLRLSSAVKRKPDVLAGVVGLLAASSKTAIFRGIRAVVISPIDCFKALVMLLRPKDKCLYVVPFGYNCDAAAAVTIIIFSLGIVAAGHHLVPRRIKAMVILPVFGYVLKASAAATANSAPKVIAWNHLGISTVAADKPSEIPSLVRSPELNNREPVKSFASQIIEKGMIWFSVAVRHVDLLVRSISLRAVREVTFLGGSFFIRQTEMFFKGGDFKWQE